MDRRPFKNLRWYIAVMLCLSSELNYLDRQTLSILADTIQRELNLTTIDYSRITSSFLISYAVMYAVSGKLVDILGTRRAFMIFVSCWSIANMLHAFANTALQFRFYRFILGAAEPANFPAGVKAVSEWFPMRERALAVGVFNAGTALGSALAVPVVSWIALTWGWRYAFVMTGAVGFIWVAVWAMFYDLFNLSKVGLYIWIPYVALTVGNISSGAIPRYLISRGWSVNRARKSTMLAVSCLMPIFCLLVTRVSAPTIAVVMMTAIMFGHAAWGNITLPAEVFPKHVVGTISGFGGALGAVVGAVTQWYIGSVVETLSFAPIFAACAVMYLLAFGLVHWLIGELGFIRNLAPAQIEQSVP